MHSPTDRKTGARKEHTFALHSAFYSRSPNRLSDSVADSSFAVQKHSLGYLDM